MKILIVDDDEELIDSLKSSLSDENFIVECAKDGEKGSYLARTSYYDLIILDYSLPKKSGLKVLDEVRSSKKHLPILILSSTSDINAKVNLLEGGADDYLTKPFSFHELLARIKALLRRPVRLEETLFRVGNLTLDTQRHIVKRDESGVYLTRKEFLLLELLMRNVGIIISRNSIMEQVWNVDGDPFSNTIEAHVLNLRKKIKTKDDQEELIHNIPGRGYKIDTSKQ